MKDGSQREILPPSGTERSGAEGSGDVNEGPPGGKRDSDAAEEEEIPFFKGEYEALMTSSPTSKASSFKS